MKSFGEMAGRTSMNCEKMEFGDIWDRVTKDSYKFIQEHVQKYGWNGHAANEDKPEVIALRQANKVIDAAALIVFTNCIIYKHKLESTYDACMTEIYRCFYKDTDVGKIEYDVLILTGMMNSYFVCGRSNTDVDIDNVISKYRNARRLDGTDRETAMRDAVVFGVTPKEQKT